MCAQLAKFAEDDRIEQMNAQRRRLRQVEHRREIERLLVERRAMFEAERDAAAAEHEADGAREQERLAIVEEERMRILRAHAAVLGLHDLPKGVLKNDADRALFSQLGASPGAPRRPRGERACARSRSAGLTRCLFPTRLCAPAARRAARDAGCALRQLNVQLDAEIDAHAEVGRRLPAEPRAARRGGRRQRRLAGARVVLPVWPAAAANILIDDAYRPSYRAQILQPDTDTSSIELGQKVRIVEGKAISYCAMW